jgi:hypothetical protein
MSRYLLPIVGLDGDLAASTDVIEVSSNRA